MGEQAASQAVATITVEIKNRRDGRVLCAAQIPSSTPSGLQMRAALEQATGRDADLRGANLRGADLRDADLADANLRDANLRGADLTGANLADANDKKLTLIGNRPYISIGPIGSRNDALQAFITDAGAYVRAGCFFGSLDEFRSAVDIEHGDNRHGREYAAAIALIDAHAAIWSPAAEVATQPEAA